jgi:hypothetical protein
MQKGRQQLTVMQGVQCEQMAVRVHAGRRLICRHSSTVERAAWLLDRLSTANGREHPTACAARAIGGEYLSRHRDLPACTLIACRSCPRSQRSPPF